MASVFISRYQLKPEKREQFVATLQAMIDGGRQFIAEQTNFIFYGFGRDPNEFVAIESWKSEEVVNGLRASPEFKQAFAALMACAAAPMEMEIFRDWGDDASVFDIYPRGRSRVHDATGNPGVVFL
jgi:quinol monooxygenase YgiN